MNWLKIKCWIIEKIMFIFLFFIFLLLVILIFFYIYDVFKLKYLWISLIGIIPTLILVFYSIKIDLFKNNFYFWWSENKNNIFIAKFDLSKLMKLRINEMKIKNIDLSKNNQCDNYKHITIYRWLDKTSFLILETKNEDQCIPFEIILELNKEVKK